MKIVPGYENMSLEKFSEQMMKYVDECRQLIGYQKDPDWECPCLKRETRDTIRSQYPPGRVGSVMCLPCLIKETKDWQALGLPLPAPLKYEDVGIHPVEYGFEVQTESKTNNISDTLNDFYVVYDKDGVPTGTFCKSQIHSVKYNPLLKGCTVNGTIWLPNIDIETIFKEIIGKPLAEQSCLVIMEKDKS